MQRTTRSQKSLTTKAMCLSKRSRNCESPQRNACSRFGFSEIEASAERRDEFRLQFKRRAVRDLRQRRAVLSR